MSRAVVFYERGTDLDFVILILIGTKDLSGKNLSSIVRNSPHVGSTAMHGPIAGLE